MVLPHGDIVESHPFPTDLAFPTIQVTVQVTWRCALGLYDSCRRIMSSHVRLSDPLPRVVALMWQIQTHDTQPKINNKKSQPMPTEVWLLLRRSSKKTAPRKKHSAVAAGCSASTLPGLQKVWRLFSCFSLLSTINHDTNKKNKHFFYSVTVL